MITSLIALFYMLTTSMICSNVEVVISHSGIKKKNHCNIGIINSFLPEIDLKEHRIAWQSDKSMTDICPNNKYTCCSVAEMQPMLEQFRITRDLLLYKNKMLEKLLVYFDTVAKESYDNFLKGFTKHEIQCLGEKRFEKMGQYYDFINHNSHSVMEMVNTTSRQIQNFESALLCTACSPINEILYKLDVDTRTPVLLINKMTCKNIVEISYNRQNLDILWNQINKIIEGIDCKDGEVNDKDHDENGNKSIKNDKQLKSLQSVEDKYIHHEECLEDTQNFMDIDFCAELCKSELELLEMTDIGLYRIKIALKKLKGTFEDNKINADQTPEDIVELEEHQYCKFADYYIYIFVIIFISFYILC